MFCIICRKHEEKMKKISGFPEAFIQGNDNCQTMIKVRFRHKLLTKVNISKAQNVENLIFQLCSEPMI